MSKTTQPTPQGAAILSAVGAKGTDATFTQADFETLKAQIGGTVRAYRLDQSTVILYDSDRQTTMFLNEQNLVGTLALCGVDRADSPVSLTVRQVAKYGKIFKAPRAAKNNAEKGGCLG